MIQAPGCNRDGETANAVHLVNAVQDPGTWSRNISRTRSCRHSAPFLHSPSFRKSRMHRAKSYPDNRQEYSGGCRGKPALNAVGRRRSAHREPLLFPVSVPQTARTTSTRRSSAKEGRTLADTTSPCSRRTTVKVGGIQLRCGPIAFVCAEHNDSFDWS